MNNAIQFEDRVSGSRSKHEGESSAEVCDRLSRTRVSSQRQLPTDHDYAVPTREYQLDQSSPLPASAAADPVLEIQKQKPPHRFEDVDRVTPYQCPVCRLHGPFRQLLGTAAMKRPNYRSLPHIIFALPTSRCHLLLNERKGRQHWFTEPAFKQAVLTFMT